MKITYTIERNDNGIHASTQCRGKNHPIYYSPAKSDESQALRALAFELLQRAGAYEFNPWKAEPEEQASIMFDENAPIFAGAGK